MVSDRQAQMIFREALGAHLSEQNTQALVEALRVLAQSSGQSQALHTLSRRLIDALMTQRSAPDQDRDLISSPEFLTLLGRLDQLLGQQAAAQTHTETHRIDEKAQRLITELEAIDSQKHHPMSLLDSDDPIKKSHPIDQSLLAPWPVSLHQKDHWVFEFGPDLAIALPLFELKALVDAPRLTATKQHSEGGRTGIKLWGFSGVEWANAPLPVVALTPPPAYRRALGICVGILQTPREVASDFGYFGWVCPSLPRLVSADELSQDRHQFIDWVAVVRAIKELF